MSFNLIFVLKGIFVTVVRDLVILGTEIQQCIILAIL